MFFFKIRPSQQYSSYVGTMSINDYSPYPHQLLVPNVNTGNQTPHFPGFFFFFFGGGGGGGGVLVISFLIPD